MCKNPKKKKTKLKQKPCTESISTILGTELIFQIIRVYWSERNKNVFLLLRYIGKRHILGCAAWSYIIAYKSLDTFDLSKNEIYILVSYKPYNSISHIRSTTDVP